ncbi:hypothetical protein EPUL_006365 [Erysiphe pulchra]|uniref:Uncharacterized protein n=1 Tax=Erysiphe pulchra TaxID=225359 RepID=A0A2S4PR73_9PEZI|nr:hypothetical protein EPUL_006365 [Erysiphe pulchra]
MSSTLLTGHYYCVSCEEVIPDVALCSKHYFECHSPNILRIRLVAHSKGSQRSSTHKSKAHKDRRDASLNISQASEATTNSRNMPMSPGNASNVRNSAASISNMREATPDTSKAYNVARKRGTTHVYENKEVTNNNHFKRNNK